MKLNFNDFSNGVVNYTIPNSPEWVGTGVFDELMKAINGNIKVQYESGRIKGPEYAEVYLGSMQTAIAEALKFLLVKDLTEKDIEMKEVDIANNVIAGENLIKQGALIEEQIKTSYTDRVMKDKQTAMLGMDGVMKKQNLVIDKDVVYTPKYII